MELAERVEALPDGPGVYLFNTAAGRVLYWNGWIADDGKGIELFVSGDQIRKGAATNAVQIAERLV